MRLSYFTLVVLAGLTAVACGTATKIPAPTPARPTLSATPAPTATTPAPVANVCQANPAPATSAQVVVTQPTVYQQVTSPLTVRGSINAFEATFRIAIKDASGNDLANQMGHSPQGQALSPFSESVPFTVSAQTPACLWVFQISAKDGSPVTIQQVSITLLP
jgi:hypothetical protein